MFHKKNHNFILTYLCLMSIILLPLIGCQSLSLTKNADKTASESESESESDSSLDNTNISYDSTCFGVVVKLDTKDYKISVYNISNKETMEFTYTGGTDVRNSYDNVIAMSQVELGSMVDGGYDKASRNLKKLTLSKDTWEYEGVTGFTIDRTNRIMDLPVGKYEYEPTLVIISDKELLDPSELSEEDEITVRGYGTTIYSINVTKGHGYVSLENAEYFIGGTVTVGKKIIYTVSDPMLMIVPEGDYTLDISKDGEGGQKSLTVVRNRETKVDVKNLRASSQKIGSIQFIITPAAAKLYVDDAEKNHKEVLELTYGTYPIKIEAEGYIAHTEDLVVDESFQKKSITLEALEEITSLQGEEVVITLPSTSSGEEQTESGTTTPTATSSTTPTTTNGTSGTTSTGTSESSSGGASPQNNGPNSQNGLNSPNTPNSPNSPNAPNSPNTPNSPNASNGSNTPNSPNSSNRPGGANSNTPGSQTSRPGSSVTGTDFQIHITEPAGAEVYFNGEYKGVAPIYFNKVTGTHTIILKQEGYATKSYTVEIEDSLSDVYFSFAQLVR